MKCRPIIIMRATQKNRMSNPVTSTDVGVERVKILGFVRPAHGAEGPQGGREPRVEHVGFLHQFRGAAIGAGRGIFLGNDELAALGQVHAGTRWPHQI